MNRWKEPNPYDELADERELNAILSAENNRLQHRVYYLERLIDELEEKNYYRKVVVHDEKSPSPNINDRQI